MARTKDRQILSETARKSSEWDLFDVQDFNHTFVKRLPTDDGNTILDVRYRKDGSIDWAHAYDVRLYIRSNEVHISGRDKRKKVLEVMK